MATSLQMLPNVDNPVERILPNQWHILCATSLPPPSLPKKTNKQKEYPKKFMESEKQRAIFALFSLSSFLRYQFNSSKKPDIDNNILTHFLRSFHPRYPRKGDDSAKAAIRSENTMIPFLFHKGKRVMIGYMEHKKTVSPSHLEHCQNQSDNHLYNGQIAKQAVSWSGAVIPETVSYKQLQVNQ